MSFGVRFVVQPVPKKGELVVVKQVQPASGWKPGDVWKKLKPFFKIIRAIALVVMCLVIVFGLYLHFNKGKLPWGLGNKLFARKANETVVPHDAWWLGTWEGSNMTLWLSHSDKVRGEFVMHHEGIDRGFVSTAVEFDEKMVLITMPDFCITAGYSNFTRRYTTYQYLLLRKESDCLLYSLPIYESFTLTPAHLSGKQSAVYPGHVEKAYQPVTILHHQ